jgi:hypothetical protein
MRLLEHMKLAQCLAIKYLKPSFTLCALSFTLCDLSYCTQSLKAYTWQHLLINSAKIIGVNDEYF